jgi:hypothetical protein
MEGFPPKFLATRHSRARGNPGLFFAPISLDTRFRGYDGTLGYLRIRVLNSIDHLRTRIFEGAPSAAEPHQKSTKRTHRRGAEVAELRVYLIKFFSRRTPHLRGKFSLDRDRLDGHRKKLREPRKI